MIKINLERTNDIFDKLVAHIGSFLDKVVRILIPLKYPIMYRSDEMEEFKRTMSGLGDKSLLNIITAIDIYVGIKMADDLKARISGKDGEVELVHKMQGVADFKEVISNYIEMRSVQK